MGEHRDFLVLLVSPRTRSPVRKPGGERKIDCFVEVELEEETDLAL